MARRIDCAKHAAVQSKSFARAIPPSRRLRILRKLESREKGLSSRTGANSVGSASLSRLAGTRIRNFESFANNMETFVFGAQNESRSFGTTLFRWRKAAATTSKTSNRYADR